MTGPSGRDQASRGEQAPSRDLRSLLFVPGDSERKQTKALGTSADALILDLEDSVDVSQLPTARARVSELLRSRPDRSRQQLWVRVNPLSSDRLLEDLAALFGDSSKAAPDGIVLPKANGPREVEEVAHYLAAFETRVGGTVGSTRIIVIATETPEALLSLPQYPDAVRACPALTQRLAGLTWGAEDLGAALSVTGRHDDNGALTFTFQMARSACLVTAAALGVQAIDGVYVDFRNAEGLKRDSGNARRDGFTGKLAIHPDQATPINEAFTPTALEIEKARRIIDAFAAAPGAGVVSLDGQMVDRPHLVQARRIVGAAQR